MYKDVPWKNLRKSKIPPTDLYLRPTRARASHRDPAFAILWRNVFGPYTRNCDRDNPRWDPRNKDKAPALTDCSTPQRYDRNEC